MTGGDLRTGVVPGEGVVAAYGGAATVVAFPATEPQEAFLDRLLAMAEAAGEDPSRSGRRLARAIAGVLVEVDPDEVPAFGLLTPDGDDVVAVLHGSVELEAAGEDPVRLSGAEVATWVDRLLRAPTSVVLRGSGGSQAMPDTRSDLHTGVVRGAGVALGPRGAPTRRPRSSTAEVPLDLMPTPEPSVPVPRGEPEDDPTVLTPPEPASLPAAGAFVVGLLDEPEDDEPERAPLPLPDEAPADDDGGPVVEGVLCRIGHLNDPNSFYCSQCGRALLETHNIVRGPRPPLGVLVIDDGATFALDCNYIIGREPEDSPEVMSGRAHALRLDDPQRTLSRVHAQVVLDGWEVKIGDAGSVNGTYVASTADGAWNRLTGTELLSIRPGTRILVGHRVLVFDSHHRT